MGERGSQVLKGNRIMKTPGDDLASLLSGAQQNVLIVAPFIRSEAFSRLLDSIPIGTETTVVTRWRLADLLVGTSDLGVYDLAKSRGIPLYSRYDLHAKFFAADNMCLVGSANVTLTALGWKIPANLELLTPVTRTADHIVKFEERLLTGAVYITEEQRNRLEELLEKLHRLPTMVPETTMGLLPPNWVPRIRNPEELYLIYRGNDDISRSAQETMQEDLAQIGIVPGMDEEGFRAWVAATITQTPLVSQVIQLINKEGQVTEDTLKDLLTKIGVNVEEYKPRNVLETLERWLTYFLPTQYQTTQDSIKLVKAKRI